MPSTTCSTARVPSAFPDSPPELDLRLPSETYSAFYLSPTPRLQRLKHLPDQGQAPATKPAAKVLPALVMSFVHWVTRLSGVSPRAYWPYVRPPGRHSFHKRVACNFRGQNIEASPYPLAKAFRRDRDTYRLPDYLFGNVSQKTDWQALAGLSWLSYSWSLGLRVIPEAGRAPATDVTTK